MCTKQLMAVEVGQDHLPSPVYVFLRTLRAREGITNLLGSFLLAATSRSA